MINEEDEIAFVIWTADIGNASRSDFNALEEGKRDKWQRMARAAILQMRVLRIID